MPIEIKISDISNTPHEDILKVIDYLETFIPKSIVAPRPSKQVDCQARMHGVPKIDPDDVPDVGANPHPHQGAYQSQVSPQNEKAAEDLFSAGFNAPPPGTLIADPSSIFGKPEPALAHVNEPAVDRSVPTVELDKNGWPWDARIHAGTRTKNADGGWKKRKGVDDNEVARVTAELNQLMMIKPVNPLAKFKTAAELGMIAAPVPNVPPTPAQSTDAPDQLPTIAASQAVAHALPTHLTPTHTLIHQPPNVQAFAPPTAENVKPPMTFVEFLTKVTTTVHTGALSQQQVDAAYAQIGLPSIAGLMTRPDLIPNVCALLGIA